MVNMLNEILKKEINSCGKSRYKISTDTGIDAAILCKYINGQRGIKADTADKLLRYFNYKIVKKTAQKEKSKRAKK
jgi:plasmid maintenance system antidote protein VapI